MQWLNIVENKMKVVLFVLIVYWQRVVGLDLECCPEGALYNRQSKLCVDDVSNATVQIIPGCIDHFSHVNNTFNLSFSLRPDGNIIMTHGGESFKAKLREFCVTITVDFKNVLVICDNYDEIPEGDERVTEILYFISGILFAVTALIYLLLPELRDLHGQIISTLCGTCCIGWILMSLLHKLPGNIHLCAASGFTVYFCNMSSFFWMNILSVQVFRSISSPNRDEEEKHDYKYYSLYGWGCPLLFLGCSIITNYVPGSHRIIPGFGTNTCWFINNEALWVYYFGPATILIIVNCVLYSWTIIKICKSNTPPSQRYRTLAYRVWMSARLFVVMGLMWMFILANSALGYNTVFGLLVNIYHMCHGIAVFILLVLRRRVITALAKRGLRLIPVDCFLIADDEEACIEETSIDDNMTVNVPLDK